MRETKEKIIFFALDAIFFLFLQEFHSSFSTNTVKVLSRGVSLIRRENYLGKTFFFFLIEKLPTIIQIQ
jgi:hypothetical protein